MNRMKFGNIGALALVAALVLLPGAAFATWSAYTDDGTHYGIREGGNKIPLNLTEKVATRTAKKVNKALDKDKEGTGFVDAGVGPCGDPLVRRALLGKRGRSGIGTVPSPSRSGGEGTFRYDFV